MKISKYRQRCFELFPRLFAMPATVLLGDILEVIATKMYRNVKMAPMTQQKYP